MSGASNTDLQASSVTHRGGFSQRFFHAAAGFTGMPAGSWRGSAACGPLPIPERAAGSCAAVLGDHFRVAAVRAHLLELDGEAVAAAGRYAAAAARATSLPEKRYLTRRAARLQERASG